MTTQMGYGMATQSAREILAANLKALMQKPGELATTPGIERSTARLGVKVGKSTVDRLLRCETPVNVDYIEAIAKAFGLDAWQLLVPGLQGDNPPVLRSVTAGEEEMYRSMRKLVKAVAMLPDPKDE